MSYCGLPLDPNYDPTRCGCDQPCAHAIKRCGRRGCTCLWGHRWHYQGGPCVNKRGRRMRGWWLAAWWTG